MTSIPWCENDKLFKALVTKGHSWQYMPYVFLTLSGFKVEMPELTIRDDISEAGAWLDTYDLLVDGKPIEVKSRPFPFTHPGDWPLDRAPAFLDTQKKWEAKSQKPYAYIFVSKATGCMVATCSIESVADRWQTIERRDRVRNIVETFYAVPLEYLVTMDVLVDALRGKRTCRTTGTTTSTDLVI